jgi:hypothetical protein
MNKKGDLFVKPLLNAVQFIPLFVERKTPPSVPARRFALPIPLVETASVYTYKFVKPEFISVQFVPLLVERNTPLQSPLIYPHS